MSAPRTRPDDGQLRLPDWVDGALGAEGRSRATPRPAGARRPATRPRASGAIEGQTALDLAAAQAVPADRGVVAGKAAQVLPGTANRWLLLTATAMLLLYGLVMAYSASAAQGYFGYGSSFYFLKRQVLYAVVGVILMLILSRIDYTLWRRLAWPAAGATLFLLAAVLVPGVGTAVNGARRWIDAAGISFQPSEVAKPVAVLLAAALVAQRPRELAQAGRFAFIFLAATAPFALFILIGKDLSTTGILILAVMAVLVAAGARWRHLLAAVATMPVLVGLLVLAQPYRMSRIVAFLDPWSHATHSGFQALQAAVSVAAGGVSGVGLGDSVQKFGYLPEQSTDMITGIIGEELGLIGLVLLIVLYLLLALAGMRIARACKEPFGKYVAIGLTAAVVGQALLNLAAALGLLPVIGLPLPLVSLGGSSLIAVLAGIGVMLNISTNRRSFIFATHERRPRAGGGGRHGRPSVARAGGR